MLVCAASHGLGFGFDISDFFGSVCLFFTLNASCHVLVLMCSSVGHSSVKHVFKLQKQYLKFLAEVI